MMASFHCGLLFIVLCMVSGLGTCTRGVDVSDYVSSSHLSCLKQNGYQFVIVRAYQSLCRVDPYAVRTLANAKAMGLLADVYMFPSPRCSKSASTQVKEMVYALRNSSYGQIWLDIEGSQYWKGSASANQAFFNELLSAAIGSGKTVGVYSSLYQWSSIMGSRFSGGASHQLWYAHYDNNPSFSDFRAFGGWSKPKIKQYAGDKSACGVGIDMNFY